MTCRPWRWLWGLVPLALVALLVVLGERHHIEQDLTARAKSALNQAGLSWATADFDWRDAVVSGTAASDEQRARAVAIVHQVHGVRRVVDQATLVKESKNYFFLARRKKDRIKLLGHVPTDADRNAVIGMVNASFPGLEINDRMKLARGAISGDFWLAGISFGLKQLGRLEEGQVSLSHTAFSLRGRAQNLDSYRIVKSELSSPLPNGLKLDAYDLIPPRIKPFPWTAILSKDELVVSGYSPSEAFKSELQTTLRRLLPQIRLSDLTEVADGEPGGWIIAARAVLQLLPQLKSGKVAFLDEDLSITGTAVDEAAALSIGQTLSDTIPKRFRITTKLEVAKAEPTVSPYRWAARYSGERVVLTGYVPDEATRNAILSSIKGHLPIVTVEDRMQLGEGEMALTDWRTGVAFALARLADLKYGEARLRDLTLSLSGQARDAASHVALKQAISTDLPSGLALAKVSITPPTFNPYRWSARSTDTGVTLAGHVPHDGARGQIVAQTERLFPGRSIQDRMVLGAGAPNLSIWHRGVRFALEHLAKLKDGETTLTNLALNVTGRAVDASSLQAVKSALANSLPEGVTLSGATIAPPLVSPFKWSAFIAGRKVVLSGHVPSAQARATLLKNAATRFKDKTVLDRMSHAAGLPGPMSDWLIATEAGLSALAELSNGQVTLIDAELAVEGLAETPIMAKQIAVRIEALLPKGYRLNHRIAAKRQPEPNVVWRATINNDRIVLSGEVPGAQARTALLASARLQNKGLVVADQMRVVDGASQRWQVTAVAALRMLSKLASGRAELSGQRLRIVGETDDPTLAERVRKFLRSGLPEGYQGDDVVTVRALAPTAPGRRAERVGDAAPEPGMTADPSGSLDAVESPNPARHSVDGVNETVRQKTARISPSEVAAVLATNKRVEPRTCQVLLDTTVRNGRINFPRRSARILPESLPTLVRLSSIAKRCPNTRIKISGHTDSDGDDRFNQSLSERRARSIVGYLVDKGIENARLQAVGFGEKQPLVPNTSSKNKARNRRIEFSIKMP